MANYARVLELDPDHVATLNNLGVALQSQACASGSGGVPCDGPSRIKPDYAEAHSNLGNSLKDQGKLEEAVACYGAPSSSIQTISMLTTTWEMPFVLRDTWPSR